MERLLVFEWRIKREIVPHKIGEWKVHYHDEGRGGGWPPLGCCPPHLYKEEVETLSFDPISPSLICPLVGLFLPLLASPPLEHLLRRSPAQDLLHHHHHHVVVLLEFPRIHYFRCPTGARDGGRRAVRVTDHGCAARLWR